MDGISMRQGNERPKRWQVVEQFSEAKDKEKGSEDAHVITDSCIIVLDGVSSPNGDKENGFTPAQYAVESARRVLQEHPEIDSRSLVSHLTQALREARERYHTGTPSFVFAAFFPNERVIVRVGDCSYLIDGEGNNPGLQVDRVRGVLRKRILARELAAGAQTDQLLANDPTAARMRGLRDWQDHYANNPDAKDLGYGVIDGTDVPERFIEYIPVPPEAKTVVLASDGYPPMTLKMTLAESENALKKVQEENPLGLDGEPAIRNLKPVKEGQSSTDDRTYLRIER